MIAAVDPGLSGGVAWMDKDKVPHANKMPRVEPDIAGLIRRLVLDGVTEVWVEDPPMFVGRKVSAQSLCKLHRNLGVILGALAALGVRTVMVKPHDWQKHFRLGVKKDHGPRWKNVLAAEASRRFPSIDVTLAVADSLLLLDYGNSLRCHPVYDTKH